MSFGEKSGPSGNPETYSGRLSGNDDMVTADGGEAGELSKLEQSYELLGELSRDERVTVYAARERSSGKEVAIKVLRAADAHGRESLAHYASDARMLTALQHPNIIDVHAVKWLSEDVVAVVTERVRGPSLRQVLDVAGTLPVARATEVVRGLGRALAWAHSSQIMHRDMRPENVIFEERTGRVVLSDFGLARRVANVPDPGEPDPYRPPELADGRYPDRRSDVYSLGIIGWELLTGRRPWPDDMEPPAPGERAPEPPPLAEVRPGLPPALVAAIEGAVQLDRDRRIPDVVTFMERLTAVAPPTPEETDAEEHAPDEDVSSGAPLEWVALPVPRMPLRSRPRAADREVTRPVTPEQPASARKAAVEPSAPAPTPAGVPAPGPVADEAEQELGRSAEPERPRSYDVAPLPAGQERAAFEPQSAEDAATELGSPTESELPATRPARPERQPRARRSGTKPEVVTSPLADEPPRGEEPRNPVRPLDSSRDEPAQRPSSRAGIAMATGATGAAASAGAAAASSAATTAAPAQKPQTDVPRSRAAKGSGSAPRAARPEAAVPESATPLADVPLADPPRARTAPGAETPLADMPQTSAWTASLGDAPAVDAPLADRPPTRDQPPPGGGVSRTTADIEREMIERWSAPLSDVELPPPEPVPFADTRPEPITGPISGPVRTHGYPPERLETRMRGGLGTPLAPKPRESKKREKKRGSAGTPAPALQPMWDTPVEFPLPAMPDPRPTPAHGIPAPSAGRRFPLTRRGITIAAVVIAALIGAFTLARLERAPDSTAQLMRPETPAGYGGDVVLERAKTDSNVVRGPASATPGGAPATGGTGRNSSSPAGSTPTAPAPSGRSPSSGAVSPPPTTDASAARAAAPVTSGRQPAPGATTTSGDRSGAAAAQPSPTQPAAAQPASRTATPTQPPPSRTAAARDARSGESTRASTSPAERTTPAGTPSAAAVAEDAPAGPCASAALADQRACLNAHLARSDADLNQTYGDVIVAMRRRASSAPGDPDPPEVQRLRALQRSWVSRRDAECRRRGRGREGRLWAPARAQCLGEFSAERNRELSAMLARLRRE